MKKHSKSINIVLSGIVATKIINEAEKIGEKKNPSYWIYKHFHEYFKIEDGDKK